VANCGALILKIKISEGAHEGFKETSNKGSRITCTEYVPHSLYKELMHHQGRTVVENPLSLFIHPTDICNKNIRVQL